MKILLLTDENPQYFHVDRKVFSGRLAGKESCILQKLNYMHDNPLAERWQLAGRAINYRHSSASQYNIGKVGRYEVKDYREVLASINSF